MFGLMETVFPFLFITIFVIVIGVFIAAAVRGIGQWSKNNAAPRLSVPASVSAKRTSVHHHHMTNGAHIATNYYVTFEVESGDRMELHVSGEEYGLLAEGDRGTLSFQWTRYLSFTRGA